MIAVAGSTAISFAAGVLGLAVLLGGVIAVLFSQLRRNTTSIVREENNDLRLRLETVEKRENECKERLAALETTTKHVVDMLSGAAAVTALETTVAFQHNEVLERLKAIDARMARRRT